MFKRFITGCAILGITLVCIGNLFIWAETALSAQEPAVAVGTSPKEISVRQAASKKVAGAYFLDVRELHEFVQGHIPGAVTIPLGQLKDRLDELPRDKEIVVVCLSGARSMMGLEILRKAGYEKSTSLAGGMNSWKTAGYPAKTGR